MTNRTRKPVVTTKRNKPGAKQKDPADKKQTIGVGLLPDELSRLDVIIAAAVKSGKSLTRSTFGRDAIVQQIEAVEKENA